MNNILEIKNLSVLYGTVRALEDVSFFVKPGEIVALLGHNGAGKSTALKAVCGLVPATKGEITFQGESIKGLSTDALVRKGLSLVPENRRVFPSMSVLENLEMGAFILPVAQNTEVKNRIGQVFELFPKLDERKNQKAGTLSTGEQQMLALGRALMLKPSLLLLDEPSLGLSPSFVEMIFEKLVEINKGGTSILLVEQNVHMALQVCYRGYVFKTGSIALEGEKEALIKNENIKKVFLGI